MCGFVEGSKKWSEIAVKLTNEIALEIDLEDLVWDRGELDVKATVQKFKKGLDAIK